MAEARTAEQPGHSLEVTSRKQAAPSHLHLTTVSLGRPYPTTLTAFPDSTRGGSEQLYHRVQSSRKDSMSTLGPCLPLTGHSLTSFCHYPESRGHKDHGRYVLCACVCRKSEVLFSSSVHCSAGLKAVQLPNNAPQLSHVPFWGKLTWGAPGGWSGLL